MIKKTLATLVGLLTLAVVAPVDAMHSSECWEETIYFPGEKPPPELDPVPDMYPAYVAYDYIQTDPWMRFSIWIYEETNGRNGLQRDDDFCFNGPYTRGVDADTIIF